MNTIASIFTYSADRRLDLSEEVDLIAAAQAGDETAKEALLETYAPALRGAVSRFTRDGSIEVEDAQATALLGFAEVLAQHDASKGDRLAGRLLQRVTAALAEAATSTTAFAIPERTLSRFYGILRTADGDTEKALEICGEFKMTRETFTAVLEAVRNVDRMDGSASSEDEGEGWGRNEARPLWPSTSEEIVDVEDRILVEVAFDAVDDEEERICRLAYGFTAYDPVPDAEIAHRVGLTRPTVQRRRASALDKMRKATGVLPA